MDLAGLLLKVPNDGDFILTFLFLGRQFAYFLHEFSPTCIDQCLDVLNVEVVLF